MFSDIASFTNISEKLSAQEVIQMLNLYFKQTNNPIIKSK
jgi:class 3 adenylate cyclase